MKGVRRQVFGEAWCWIGYLTPKSWDWVTLSDTICDALKEQLEDQK